MGATVSILSLPTLTVEQVGDLVAGCGDAYLPYRASFIHPVLMDNFCYNLISKTFINN